MRIIVVAGARPNFMKAAPLIKAAEKAGIEALLLHTGQHYDEGMSNVFFDDLDLPKPYLNLEVGSGTHAEVTARCLIACEQAFASEQPDWVLVVGDINSTVAATLAAVKLHIPVGHVEAGLRSFDRKMPEEINRVVTDAICDLLFVTEQAGVVNLCSEGIPEKSIHLVGNVMIDTLLRLLPIARERGTAKNFDMEESKYALVTLHRPSNVDDHNDLEALIENISHASESIKMFFPVHPRTKARLEQMGIFKKLSGIQSVKLAGPVGYIDFVSLMTTARVVLTDSGGIQEETTVLGVPCLTLRDNTERPITIEQGTNHLVGAHGDKLAAALEYVLSNKDTHHKRPDLWDGRAAERIMSVLCKL